MRAREQVDFVFVDGWVGAGFVGCCEVFGHVEEGGVVEAVDPCLAVGLRACDGPDVA